MAQYKDYEVLVGTYEEYVLGFRLSPQLKSVTKYDLLPSFSVKAHCGPVRCLTAGSRFAVSGGSDENCKIFDLVKRVEHGLLDHHEGTVSALVTHGPSAHLITASDDNSLGIVKMGSWQLEKSLYKHSAGITALAIHPSGKLAFSAGKDKKMITWNLVKARPAFISNIKGIAELLVVSPDGTRYAVGLHRRVDIYSMENAAVEYSIDLKVSSFDMSSQTKLQIPYLDSYILMWAKCLGNYLVSCSFTFCTQQNIEQESYKKLLLLIDSTLFHLSHSVPTQLSGVPLQRRGGGGVRESPCRGSLPDREERAEQLGVSPDQGALHGSHTVRH